MKHFILPNEIFHFTWLNSFENLSFIEYLTKILRRFYNSQVYGFCPRQPYNVSAKCACGAAILYPFDAVITGTFRRLSGNAASFICIN